MEMYRFSVLSLIAAIMLLPACGGGGSSNDTGLTSYRCSIPCLKDAPTLNTATVSSATGGTVTVSFDIEGAFAELDMIHVSLSHISEHRDAGANFVLGPLAGPEVSIDIVVDAGTAEGTYYPDIFLETTAGDYGQYVLATDFSETKYLYGQTVGTTETHALSPISVPKIIVTP